MNIDLQPTEALTDLGGFSVNGFCRWAGIGRTAAYAEIKDGRLAARKFGKRTIIPVAEARRWFEALPSLKQGRQ
jgi:hypothetical protein